MCLKVYVRARFFTMSSAGAGPSRILTEYTPSMLRQVFPPHSKLSSPFRSHSPITKFWKGTNSHRCFTPTCISDGVEFWLTAPFRKLCNQYLLSLWPGCVGSYSCPNYTKNTGSRVGLYPVCGGIAPHIIQQIS